jgi:hypothetical protein
MNGWTNGKAWRQEASSGELLTALAAQVDRQVVLDLGGEFLEDSGFENEFPEAAFERKEESNA